MILANKSPQINSRAMMMYLIDKHRDEDPKILRGSRFLVNETYDLCERFTHKAVHTVLSFKPGETITEEQKQKLLDDFEKTFFGNMRGRINYIAVEHNEREHYHIHLWINKIDLKTGKAFNPFKPGQKSMDAIKDFTALQNEQFGFEQVTKKELSRYGKDERLKLDENGYVKIKLKTEIDRELKGLVRSGKLKNRDELVKYLKSQGYAIAREGKDYISIDLGEKQNIRLKGDIYSTEVSYEDLLKTTKDRSDLRDKKIRVNENIDELNKYNKERYDAKEKKPMYKINTEITIAKLSIPFEEKTEAKAIAKIYGCALHWKKEEKTWELKTSKQIPKELEKYVISVKKEVSKLEVEKKTTKEQEVKSRSVDNIANVSKADFKGSSSDLATKTQQHKDTQEKTPPRASRQAVFKDDAKQDAEQTDVSSPGSGGSENEAIGAQMSVDNARASLNNAKTYEQREKARIALGLAQANLERILARLEEEKKRKIKI